MTNAGLARPARSLTGLVLFLTVISAALPGCATRPAATQGDPVPLESEDPRYGGYPAQVRKLIKEKWSYPCVNDEATGKCEYKSASVMIEFGIFIDGRVGTVTLKKSSGITIYDEKAVDAIKAASPFPPVPPAMMALAKPGSTGVKILATFRYIPVDPKTK